MIDKDYIASGDRVGAEFSKQMELSCEALASNFVELMKMGISLYILRRSFFGDLVLQRLYARWM